jgi:hypothetical protein
MATIAWLIPGLIEGSGGHRTFLQHADYLRRQGHGCRIYVENVDVRSATWLRDEIRRLFGFDFDEVYPGWSNIQAADMVFATVWYSAKVVRDLPFPCIKAYFVQDLEAQFNPMGDGYLMAENSYRYGLRPITIGRWLPAMLARDFQVRASFFDFCADLNVYRPLPGVAREKSVCFIYQPDKPRRCPELGIEALGIVKHYMPEVKIYLYGAKMAGRIWFEHENLGLLKLDDCNRLYNRCAVGLCISSTNPSRIPFEMMAAGLPVVEVHRDNTLYDFPEGAMLLCEQTPESLAAGLMMVLSAPDRAEAMGRAGIDYMRGRPIDYGLEQFGTAVARLLRGEEQAGDAPERMYGRAAMKATGAEAALPAGANPGGQLPDRGRLAFLPLGLRKALRFVYYRLRRYGS